MKKIISFISAICFLLVSFTASYAQVNYQNRKSLSDARTKRMQKNRQHICAILQKQEEEKQAKLKPAAKSTSVLAERLIAIGDYNYADTSIVPYGKTDSTYFKYSGQRGSTFNLDGMTFLSPLGEYFYGGAYPNLFLSSGFVHISTDQTNQSDVMADTTFYWDLNVMDTGGVIYGLYDIVSDLYDVNDNVTFCSDQYYPIDTMGVWDHHINTYDAWNNITSTLDVSYNTPVWDTNSITFYSYNTSHQLIEDSTNDWGGPGIWGPGSKDYYSYSSGNLVYSSAWYDSSGIWQETNQYFITYNVDNTLHTDSASAQAYGAWAAFSRDSFGYTPGINYSTYYQSYLYEETGFQENVFSKHVALSGLPDTLYSAYYSNIYDVAPSYLGAKSKGAYTYDSYNNPHIVYGFNYNITDSATGAGYYDSSPMSTTYFYYETYMSSAVQNIPPTTENIKIYPNPTTNDVTISRPDAVKGAYTLIKLTNELGQTIRTESLSWMNETENFSMAGLTTGIYLLTIQDKNGNVLTAQKIIKR